MVMKPPCVGLVVIESLWFWLSFLISIPSSPKAEAINTNKDDSGWHHFMIQSIWQMFLKPEWLFYGLLWRSVLFYASHFGLRMVQHRIVHMICSESHNLRQSINNAVTCIEGAALGYKGYPKGYNLYYWEKFWLPFLGLHSIKGRRLIFWSHHERHQSLQMTLNLR